MSVPSLGDSSTIWFGSDVRSMHLIARSLTHSSIPISLAILHRQCNVSLLPTSETLASPICSKTNQPMSSVRHSKTARRKSCRRPTSRTLIQRPCLSRFITSLSLVKSTYRHSLRPSVSVPHLLTEWRYQHWLLWGVVGCVAALVARTSSSVQDAL